MSSTSPSQPPAIDIGGRLSEQELCPDDLLKGQEEAFARDIERLQERRDEFVNVSCPACDQGKSTEAFEKFTFPYRRCDACRTLFMSPRPSPTVMNDYYANSENYQYWAEHIFPASEISRREKIHKPWLQRVVDFCEAFGVHRGTLLEVGSGFGTFASVATESGAFEKVIGVEPTPELAQACLDRGVDVIESRIEDITDEVERVDVVVSFEVIEHLFDPETFLSQCHRLLRPGGMLVVSCPNGEGFDVAMLGPESLAIDPEHVNLFNPRSIQILLDRNGFDTLAVTTPGRLDAEFVRAATLEGRFDVSADPFLQRVLVEEWEQLGWPFQQFLADNGLSAHMWTAARKQ